MAQSGTYPEQQTVEVQSASYSVEVVTGSISGRSYQGLYEVVPSEEEQVLHTAMSTMAHDLVVDPIPSNYGLITWDGSALMVS